MNDNVDTLSDAELSAVFATEICGFTHNEWGARWYFFVPDKPDGTYHIPPFATDANAVLPWLEKFGSWTIDYDPYVPERMSHKAYLRKYAIEGLGRTVAHAAVVALIRAKRAEKVAP